MPWPTTCSGRRPCGARAAAQSVTSTPASGRATGRRPRPARTGTAARAPRPAAPASITPTGRPSAVQCNGSETAGMPVRFHAEVQGVNAFWFSKSRGRVVVVADRADRQRRLRQGRGEHRVVRRQPRTATAPRSAAPPPRRGRTPARYRPAALGEPRRQRAQQVLGPGRHGRRARSAPPSRSRSVAPPPAAPVRRSPRRRARARPAAGSRPRRPRRTRGATARVGDDRRRGTARSAAGPGSRSHEARNDCGGGGRPERVADAPARPSRRASRRRPARCGPAARGGQADRVAVHRAAADPAAASA